MSRLSDIFAPVFALLSSTSSKVIKDVEDAGSAAKLDFEKAAEDVKTSKLGQLASEADAIVTKAYDALEADVKAFLAPKAPDSPTPPINGELQ